MARLHAWSTANENRGDCLTACVGENAGTIVDDDARMKQLWHCGATETFSLSRACTISPAQQ